MITVVAISSEKDFEHANKWLAHLPNYVNKLIVQTVKGGETRKISDANGLSFHDWGYEKFRFDEARNYALSLVKTDWCIMLDIDERLQIFKEDIEFIESQPENIAGLRVALNCYNGSTVAKYDSVRIMRQGVRYEYFAHETIDYWIQRNGFEIAQSPILIRHDSYSEKNLITGKLLRNYHLILDNIQDNIENRSDPKLIGDLYRTMQGLEKFGSNN